MFYCRSTFLPTSTKGSDNLNSLLPQRTGHMVDNILSLTFSFTRGRLPLSAFPSQVVRCSQSCVSGTASYDLPRQPPRVPTETLSAPGLYSPPSPALELHARSPRHPTRESRLPHGTSSGFSMVRPHRIPSGSVLAVIRPSWATGQIFPDSRGLEFERTYNNNRTHHFYELYMTDFPESHTLFCWSYTLRIYS